VISIQPREQQAGVNFNEWDGLIKLCFSRPNRLLVASFKKRKVLALLEANRRAYFEAMGTSHPTATEVLFPQTLSECGLWEARPISLDIDDFLRLLLGFNQGGIHFKAKDLPD
jgi:18S rRNA (adenine1779-N6/adenine1780-N6)-dimethyltransferase